MNMELVAKVHQLEFGKSAESSALEEISANGQVPIWLAAVLRGVIENKNVEYEFRSDGGQGASILLDANQLLGWSYVDDGESATLDLPRIGKRIQITREAILSDGTGGCRASVVALHRE